ncbi:hypothetical protein ABPG74_001580 [Tetrahymena malaccensis]
MQKLEINKVYNIISHSTVTNQELKEVVNFYQDEQEKKYSSLEPNDFTSRENKEKAFIDACCWSFLQEILREDDIHPFSREYRNQMSQFIKQQSQKPDMDIEMDTSLLSRSNASADNLQKINNLCHDRMEKSVFYYEFYQTWYNKSDKQRMQTQSYDHNKMPNFLFTNQINNNEVVSLEKSKGMLAPRSYSDLEIIQDLIYYDNHLQRFSKVIKWIQNNCLTQEAFDPQTVNQKRDQNDKIQIEQWANNKHENEKLTTVFTLLKQGQKESAFRFMKDQKMNLPLALIDSVFPYHDFLLSDSNNPNSLQTFIIQNELKNNFLVDILNNLTYSEALKERISHYKNNGFNPNTLFDQQVGNQNWLLSLSQAQLSSQEKNTIGEVLYFSYLSSNKNQIQKNLMSKNQWYEYVWATLKYLYIHEVIKRFLVIKCLLYDSIEQYYPSYENNLIDFYESPLDNYRKLFHGSTLEGNIYDELGSILGQLKEDKYETQVLMILAYLNRDQTLDQSLWINVFSHLQQTSKLAYENREKSSNSSVICEFNAKIAFCLLKSNFIVRSQNILDTYDYIIEYFVRFLIPFDHRQYEIIAFLKNLKDESIVFELMAKYIASKKSEIERKKIKQELVVFGYSDQQIQGILKELVNSQFSAYNTNDSINNISDQSIIDGLKMFIESYQNNIYLCMSHFLSAAKTFILNDKLQVYQQMREDRDIANMVDKYLQLTNSRGDLIKDSRDSDPFLNWLSAFDELMNCYKLLGDLDNINLNNKNFRNSDPLRNSNKKANNQMINENDFKINQVQKAQEFIITCERTFFKYNKKGRYNYIFIDGNVRFTQGELFEYNNNPVMVSGFLNISKQYLYKCIKKCIGVAQTFKISDEIISFLSKYYSPTYNAFTLFDYDHQELILKKSTALLTQNTKFMRTVLNL